MNEIININTMSSIEIADLTGKRHADVLRDVSVMFDALGGERSFALSSYKSLWYN